MGVRWNVPHGMTATSKRRHTRDWPHLTRTTSTVSAFCRISPARQREPAQFLLLHQRRRRHPRDAIPELEARVPRTALPRHDAVWAEPSRGCGCRSSTCGRIRTSSPTRPQIRTTTGSARMRTSFMPPRRAPRCSSRHSRISRQSRSRAALRSTTRGEDGRGCVRLELRGAALPASPPVSRLERLQVLGEVALLRGRES